MNLLKKKGKERISSQLEDVPLKESKNKEKYQRSNHTEKISSQTIL